MDGVEIRQCRAQDVDVLEERMGSRGSTRFHARRFAQQEAGEATYLVAWVGEVPVGHVLVRWRLDADLAAAVGPAPELNALAVWPPQWRSRGIGRALVAAGEDLVRARGFGSAALGVATDNHDARRLYERLGYRDWGNGTYVDRWTWIDDDGVEHEDREVCTWLVRAISPVPPAAEGPSDHHTRPAASEH